MPLYRYHVTAQTATGAWKLRADNEPSHEGPPSTFYTVLGVDKDVDILQKAQRDVLEELSYFGPMYFDIDADEQEKDCIAKVMRSTWELIQKLKDLEIKEKYIHCWLTGGRGSHILLSPHLMGVKRPEKLLPLVYEKFARMVQVPHLDMSIYSCGKGRMWRQQNMQRTNGLFKVPVSIEDIKRLAQMEGDACQQAYEQLCSEPRFIEREDPPPAVEHLKLKTLMDGWRRDAREDKKRRDKQLKEMAKIDFSALPEVPGCIEKLITEGDCDQSNWSQAAINLGAWIRARFKNVDDHVKETLIEPFLNNVTSRSHPSKQERYRHLMNVIRNPQWVFSKGSLFSTIGEKCGCCELCREDLDEDDENEIEVDENGREKWPFHEQNRIKASKRGYVLYGEDSHRALTNFTYWPEKTLGELELSKESAAEESKIRATTGKLYLPSGRIINEVTVPYSAWDGRKSMLSAFGEFPGCVVHATDMEAQRLKESIEEFVRRRGGAERQVSTRLCGLYLSPVDGKKGVYEPHYIEHSGSITLHNRRSRYRYSGKEFDSPRLIPLKFPGDRDFLVEQAMVSLMSISNPVDTAKMLGFFCAAHLKGHLMIWRKEFPLLCLYGTASAGKSSQAAAFLLLNGVDNLGNDGGKLLLEGSSLPPLFEYASTSVSVPRLIDEVNETNLSPGVYRGALSVFKICWEGGLVQRGRPAVSGRPQAPDQWKISSPLVIMSEQQIGLPSVIDRSIQIHVKQRGRTQGHVDSFNFVDAHRDQVMQIGKLMVDKAMSQDPAEYTHQKLIERYGKFMSLKELGSRPYRSHLIIYQGLDLLEQVLKEGMYDRALAKLYEIREALTETIRPIEEEVTQEFEEEVKKATNEGKDYRTARESVLAKRRAKAHRTQKTTSHTSQVIQTLAIMAADVSDRGVLRPGMHYVRNGNELRINLPMSFPAYLKECSAQRLFPPFRNSGQVETLITDEAYFDRIDTDDHGARWIVINVEEFERLIDSPLHSFREG